MASRVLVSALILSAVALAPAAPLAQPRMPEGMAAANALYAAQRYAEAATAYQAVVAAHPAYGEAYFFLANALDNQFRPSRRGDPANDRLLDAAGAHYAAAADLLVRPDQAVLLKRTLQFLAALHGPDKLNRPDQAAAVIARLIALDPRDTGSYFALVKVYEDAGRFPDAERVLAQAQAVAPDQVQVWTVSAQFYNRAGHFDRTMEMLRRVTEIEPQNPQTFYQVAVYFEEKVRKDFTLDRTRQDRYLAEGMDAIDRALALRPDYFEALTYKSLLLRQQARLEASPETQRRLLAQAEAMQRQALAARDAAARGRPQP